MALGGFFVSVIDGNKGATRKPAIEDKYDERLKGRVNGRKD
jgi:hypothetical protein